MRFISSLLFFIFSTLEFISAASSINIAANSSSYNWTRAGFPTLVLLFSGFGLLIALFQAGGLIKLNNL